ERGPPEGLGSVTIALDEVAIPTAHGRNLILKTPKPLDSETHANCILLRILVQSRLFEAAQRSLTLRPARSPSRHSDPLHQRLQQSRCLHCCSDCYRVERTSSRAGLPPLWTSAFSRRTR